MNSVTYDERKIVYQNALDKYGASAQTTKAVEEMSELIKEICKFSLGAGDREALADEIADVTIMLEQLRLIYGINDLVCDHMDMKIRRLKERLAQPDDKIAAAIRHFEHGISHDIFSEPVTTYAKMAVEALRGMRHEG